MVALHIAVAGCGPGGLAAALLLRRDGHRVRLFERFAEPQPIGSGLMIQPTGQAVLRELGLKEELAGRSARIERLFGQAGGRTVLDVRYAALAGEGVGLGTHRAALFDILYQAVRAAAVPIETGRTVTTSDAEGASRRLRFADGSSDGPFDLVVDALGTRSPLAPPTGRPLAYGALWASLDWPADGSFSGAALEQRYRRASVMAGVLPLGRPRQDRPAQAAFFWSLRADRLEHWRAGGLDAWKAQVLDLWPATRPLLDQIGAAEQLTFARYAHRTLTKPVEPALVHLGDAWHSASPQLGQGANMALLDAYALAIALRRTEDVAAALGRFSQLRSRHVRLYQAASALFTPVYQSDGRLLPLVRDRLVGPLANRWPAKRILAQMVSGLIGDPLTPLGLAADRPSGSG
ncbi:FAD-dependent oxidoreductase [Sphingomonas bacterium]|uniref:FAD-dependent oxidoreductase n=1 Tax=Sphingomonas bacterium TaxID=1895847 RepID=UPI001575AE3B|nr:NAD(P)/FAD-dependent oxidoreductase [Sphingomonas bacterium]